MYLDRRVPNEHVHQAIPFKITWDVSLMNSKSETNFESPTHFLFSDFPCLAFWSWPFAFPRWPSLWRACTLREKMEATLEVVGEESRSGMSFMLTYTSESSSCFSDTQWDWYITWHVVDFVWCLGTKIMCLCFLFFFPGDFFEEKTNFSWQLVPGFVHEQ